MKSERHALILSLIEKKNVETQEDLAELLKEREWQSRRQRYRGTSRSLGL